MKTYLLKKLFTFSLLLVQITGFCAENALALDVKAFHDTGVCRYCDLSGEPFLRTIASGRMVVHGTNFIRSSLSNCGGKGQRADFSNITGIEFDYSYADLSYASFAYAKLIRATLIGDNLTAADFTGADVTGVNFSHSILYRAKLSEKQLKTVASVCNAILPNGEQGAC